jgi:hypothetical protein
LGLPVPAGVEEMTPEWAWEKRIISHLWPEIQWIISRDVLAYGTTSGIYTIGGRDEVITYDTVQLPKQMSAYGVEAIRPVVIEDAIYSVELGGKKIRAFQYIQERESYQTPDMTRHVAHIAREGITSMALQQYPEQILWITTAEGTLAAMNIDPGSGIAAWSVHDVGGKVERVAVTRNGSEDRVWITVVRNEWNGAALQEVRSIEYLAPRIQKTVLPTEYYARRESETAGNLFLDSAYYHWTGDLAVKVDTLTGLQRFYRVPGTEALDIRVIGDGMLQDPPVIAPNGTVTLAAPASVIMIGIANKAILETTKIQMEAGRIKKIGSVQLNFYDSLTASVGPSGGRLYPVFFTASEVDRYDSPITPKDWAYNLEIDGEFDRDGTVVVECEEPLPCTIKNIIMKVDVYGP